MWIHTIAEVDERHVALELRREPGGKQGLARIPARERVSDAEPRWQSQGISGGREAFVPSISVERSCGDSSVEGASNLEGGGDGLSPLEGFLVLLDQADFGRCGQVVRQGASVTRSRGLRTVRQGPTQVMSGPDGRRRQPLCRGATIMVTAGAVGTNPTRCSGSRMPLAATRRHRTRCCCQGAYEGARGRQRGPTRWSDG